MKSNYRLAIILFFTMMLGPAMLYSGEINLNNGKTQVSFTNISYQHLTLASTISYIQFRDVNTKAGIFTELFIQQYGSSSTIGNPNLPTFRKLIEVPAGAVFSVSITNSHFQEFDCASLGILHPLMPAQASVSKGITDPSQIPFAYNQAAYLLDQMAGQPLVSVSEAGIMRAVRLARIDIAPVMYNPVTGKIRVYDRIEATVEFQQADVSATLQMKKKNQSMYFDRLYNQLPNYQTLTDTMITIAPVTYVIVSAPSFEDALQPFVNWKTRKGFNVIEAYTDDPNVGTTTASIKSYLQDLYNNPPTGYNPPTFILFVGDVAQIPAWTTGGQATDLRYCEYTGDNIPEVFYGRFSASSLTQLQPYIDKVLEYEQYLFPDPDFLNEVVMVAGADASHQMTWGNGQINYGTTYYFNSAHNLLSHTYLQPEPSGANYSQQIRNNVSDGVSYANYTAHGSEQGWADPEFVISQIAALQNDHEYCLMVGNCCLTSKYNVNCFAEEITRAANKGAIGYIGGSNNSYWDEDYWWGCGFKAVTANPTYNADHLGAYDVTFHDHGESTDNWYTTQGQMVVGGNMAVEESSTSAGQKEYYWEIYNLMGDPSVTIYFSVPPPIVSSYPAVALVGSTSFTVNTEPWAYVALSINDSVLLDAACADSTGTVDLTFAPLVDPGYTDLVITKQNRKPTIDSVEVIPASGPYLTSDTFTVSDSLGGNNNHKADFSESIFLNVTINNIGVQTATSITGTLSTSDTNVIVTSSTFFFDSIPAGGSAVVPMAFGLIIKNNVADLHKVSCAMVFSDGFNTWNSSLILTLNAPVLSIGGISVMDPAPGGNGNGILDPGETAKLKISTTNKGHADVTNGTAHLTVLPGSTPYVLVTNPNLYIGNMPAGGFGFVLFDVTANGITLPGTQVSFDYLVQAGVWNQYFTQKQLDLIIGQVPQYLIGNSTVSTCNGNFFDSGGENGNYGINEMLTMTFNPGTIGAKIQAVFNEFSLEPEQYCAYDYLKIYDGTSTMAPLIGTWCGTNSPGTIAATTSSGALTFQFRSDYADNFPGWEADISCVGGPLTLLANAFPANVCQGSTSQLVAVVTGGSGTYTYQWTPADYLDDPASATPISTPEANISYTVSVNDGVNTLVSSPVALTLAPKPDAPVITESGEQLESSATTGNQWYLDGNLIPNATGQTYTPVVSGNYSATVKDETSGCVSDPSNVIPFYLTGMENPASQHVRIYPNPFTDRLTVDYRTTETGAVRIALLDAFGKEVRVIASLLSEQSGTHTAVLAAAGLQPGLYYCRIQTSTYSIVKKVILTR
jgi:hypothetical protein